MPDELKAKFAALKTQLAPSDDLVANTLAAVAAADAPKAVVDAAGSAAPAPALRAPRWPAVLAGAATVVAIVLMISTLSSPMQSTPLWGGPQVASGGPVETTTTSGDPKSYADIFSVLSTFKNQFPYIMNSQPGNPRREPSPPMPGPVQSTMPGGQVTMTEADSADSGNVVDKGESASGTNTQVAGIDEGDIVKTDGRFLYVATGRKVAVVEALGARTHQVATIDTTNLAWAGELATGPVVDLMIDGTTLIALVHVFEAPSGEWSRSQGSWLGVRASSLKAVFYDISDPSHPVMLGASSQTGSYTTSRLSGGVLVLISSYNVPVEDIDADEPVTFVPSLNIGRGKVPLAATDVRIMPWVGQAAYTVATTIDVDTHTTTSQLAIMGDASTVYMSHDNLYLASTQWEGAFPATGARDRIVIPWYGEYDGDRTNIMRISLAGGLSLVAQGAVAGQMVNQFALDEFEGSLRVATTWWSEGWGWQPRSALWVLDSSLKLIGSLPELMNNETVQSVRFDGPVGYVVTFRQTDPLFALDLSKATAPKVLSALKIPGFSTYLHPFGEGLLLGVGVDANDEGRQTGLKLAMFDVSNPRKVSQVATAPIQASDTEVTGDHHACFVDVARGLIGFPTTRWDIVQVQSGGWRDALVWDYRVYSWNGTRFKEVKVIELGVEQLGAMADDVFARGVRVGDDFYLVAAGVVDVYDLAAFSQLTKITIKWKG